ncbi:hypothetical protein A7K94_0211655 [Modestobacter sp. VKM Ac-2676]|nr:hypothetical protein A7K94_0211655 [Modestobacter sp. VKM Ac-2676]
MDADAGQPLTWWLDHGDAAMSEVAEACVATGVWGVRRGLLRTRYGTPPAPGKPAPGKPAPEQPPSGDVVAAAVEVLATACGAAVGGPSRCSSRSWRRRGHSPGSARP